MMLRVRCCRRALISLERCLRGSAQPYSAAPQKKMKVKETLYSLISPLGSPNAKVTPVIDRWVLAGNKARFAELLRIVHDLRKRKRFSQALEVLEWTKKSGIFTYTSTEHAVEIDLIGKVHGYVSAETYFNSLNDEDRIEKTYGALLHCYVRQREVDKSLAHLQTMKEKGFGLTAVSYNDIMSLYTNIGQHEKVPEVLNEMKANGVSPDNLSYRICINSYGVRSDIDGMEKVLREMEHRAGIFADWNTYAVVANFYIKAGRKDEANSYLELAEMKLDKRDTLGYNHLISLHSSLGNKRQVLRLWKVEKGSLKCINRDYINMLKSLVRLDEIQAAEELLKAWESSKNCYDFRVPMVIIDGHINKGLCETAEAMLRNLMDKGKATNAAIWERLSARYLQMDDPDKAAECTEVATTVRGKRIEV